MSTKGNYVSQPIISVCLASYNGEKYISQQLESILVQLSSFDEIVVSDDSSTDRTVEIIKSFNDSRIKLLENNNFKSPIFNFENALKHVAGDYIFLSDQDDIWIPNKINIMMKYLLDFDLVVSDATLIDADGHVIRESFYDKYRSGVGVIKNIYSNTYLGCTMALNKKLLEIALPFPLDIPMHDMWLGLIAECFGKTKFIDNKLIYYRRHTETITTGKHASISKMLYWRYSLIKNLFLRYLSQK